MNLKKAANHGVHGGLGDKTEDCFVKEALKYSSPSRKRGSSSLNFLDSGVRRNDESVIDQRLLIS